MKSFLISSLLLIIISILASVSSYALNRDDEGSDLVDVDMTYDDLTRFYYPDGIAYDVTGDVVGSGSSWLDGASGSDQGEASGFKLF